MPQGCDNGAPIFWINGAAACGDYLPAKHCKTDDAKAHQLASEIAPHHLPNIFKHYRFVHMGRNMM
jgi:hypothetical protein